MPFCNMAVLWYNLQYKSKTKRTHSKETRGDWSMKKQWIWIILLLILFFAGCAKEQNAGSKGGALPEKEISSEPITEEATISPQSSSLEDTTAVITEADWSDYFDGINGTAVLYNPNENTYQIYQEELANTRRSPCSTFKIISSLIGLEQGIIIPDASTKAWSGECFWNDDWNKDIDFDEAFRTSCVWYFREVINEIGQDAMQAELKKLRYGNCDSSDWEGRLNTNNHNRALTGFWLESSLKISPKEQVEVMERIFGSQSAYSQKTQEQLKQVMRITQQEQPELVIYGKTGMGKIDGVTVDAWFTGFADIAQERVYFCVYLGETKEKDVTSAKAKEIALRLLADQ